MPASMKFDPDSNRYRIIDKYGEYADDDRLMDINYDEFVEARRKQCCQDPDYLCAGLVEEVGELMQLRRKALRDGKGAVVGEAQIKDELGDILWYVVALAQTLGDSTLNEIQELNIKKLFDKFGVPDEFKDTPSN